VLVRLTAGTDPDLFHDRLTVLHLLRYLRQAGCPDPAIVRRAERVTDVVRTRPPASPPRPTPP
jgi:hypothetical protein